MSDVISKNWYLVLIRGLIMLLLAYLIFQSPAGALVTYALYIGIGFIITGLFEVFGGVASRKENDNWGWTVFGGIIDIVVGYVLLAHPGLTAAMIPFIIGFWGSFYGFFLVIDSFATKGNFAIKFISGLLLILLSGVLMFNPLAAGMSIAVWVAIMLVVAGIYNIFLSFKIKSL